MVICQTEVQEYTTREEILNGREYVVVPVTMMVEGVHQGSHGALLHTAEELGKIPESWNGIPVTIGHPLVEGKPVSANSPAILEAWQIGIVFDTIINDVKLKSEAWLEKNKLLNYENLNDRISNGEIIEVSVGVFSEDELMEGTWHNESYNAVARNLRPDHLAILPNQVGACSVADGCGIRVNSNDMENNETVIDTNTEIKRQRKVQTIVKKEDLIMAEEKCTPCISKKATELIANAATQFTEKDRGWLETFEEDQLDRMVPKSVEPTVNKEVPKITPEMAVNALREGLKNEDDFIKLMPNSMQEQTRSALRLFEERKTSLIEGIIANTEKDTWTKDELQVYAVEKLEKIAKTAGVKNPEGQVNYSGMGAGSSLHNNAQNDVPLMAPAGITFDN